MISNEEKRVCINKIISLAAQHEEESVIQKELHDMLLQDTNMGKLYKYRTFDPNGYSLKSVQTGALHCSKPTVFNDPFDCKIGITFSSIYEALYAKEINLISNVLSSFIGVMRGEKDPQKLSSDELRLVQRMQNNKLITDYVSTACCTNNSEVETAQLVHELVPVVIASLQTLLEDESFSPHLRIASTLFPQILERFTPEGMLQLSNDEATFEDYARANGITDDDDEIGLARRLSEKFMPTHNPDRDNLTRLLTAMDQQIISKMCDTFLIGCLCTDYKNRLMWSHYADSHKGFCIEYDFSQMQKSLPLPVYYSTKRPLIPWHAALHEPSANESEATAQLILGLLTKDDAWSYENEWRILSHASQPADIPMPPITCIYLGAAISETNRNQLIALAEQLQIPVKQMKVDRGAYALHAHEL